MSSSDGATVTAFSVENFGPKAFQAIVDYADGKEIPTWVVNTDRTFTKDNIQSYMPEAF